MAAIGGILGSVNGKSTVAKWSIDASSDLQSFVASNTQGGTARVLGNTDWSGSYEAYGHIPGMFPGTAFAFKGVIGETTGADAEDGAEGTAIVDSVEISCDIEAGAPIKYTVSFSGNGALTLGATTFAADASAVAVFPSLSTIGDGTDAAVQLGTLVTTPVYASINDVRSWTITLSASNPSYSSSGTAGGTLRVAGPVDWSVSVSRYLADPATLEDEGAVFALKLFTTATLFWSLKWGRLRDISGLEVDRETGAVVGATYNFEMSGFEELNSTGGPVVGEIIDPTPTTFWPA